MFSVIFEVYPKSDQWNTYLGLAKMLRPELETIEGFIDNVRYASLTRKGWILSLSSWRDEKAVVRWRTKEQHHEVQERGRTEVLADYHLRVGQVTNDTRIPAGYALEEQRLDETETGAGTTVSLVDGKRPSEWIKTVGPEEVAKYLGFNADACGLIGWDVFDAVLTPGDLILVLSWKTNKDAQRAEQVLILPDGARVRRVRIVRDYSMRDRREAPQYYPELKHSNS